MDGASFKITMLANEKYFDANAAAEDKKPEENTVWEIHLGEDTLELQDGFYKIEETIAPENYSAIAASFFTLHDGKITFTTESGEPAETTGSLSASYPKPEDSTAEDDVEIRITDTEIVEHPPVPEGPVKPQTDIKADQHKQIDYLGDGKDNPDTDVDTSESELHKNARNDLYRLYLDVQLPKFEAEANVILVEDISSSMRNKDMTDLNGASNVERYEVMRQALMGTGSKTGVIDAVMNDKTDTWMSVIQFSDTRNHALRSGGSRTGTYVLQDWTNRKDTVKSKVNTGYPYEADTNYGNGSNYEDNSRFTDYEAALNLVQTQISNIPRERKDYPTYVVFLSDGLPTVTSAEESLPFPGWATAWSNNYTNQYGNWRPSPYNIIGKENDLNLNHVMPETLTAITGFKNFVKNSGKEIHLSTIGFAGNMDSPINADVAYSYSTQSNKFTGKMGITDAQGKSYYYNSILKAMALDSYETAVNGTRLLEAFMSAFPITKIAKDVEIQDTLSRYVELYTNQPDFKVTRKTKVNNEDNTVAYTVEKSDDKYIVKDSGTKIGEITIVGKVITLKLDDTAAYKDQDVFTISYNVEASSEAYAEYAANRQAGKHGGEEYNKTVGSKDSDYAENKTSEGEYGFYANDNDNTKVTFTYGEKPYTGKYEWPVIQVGKTKIEIKKVWEGKEPDGPITLKLHANGSLDPIRTLELKKEDNWIAIADNLNPKKLVVQGNGTTKYEPIVYTITEEPVEGYQGTIKYSITESPDKKSFTNITSRYNADNNTHVYYVPGVSANGSAGEIILTNTEIFKLSLKKVDSKDLNKDNPDVLKGAAFTLTKYKDETFREKDKSWGTDGSIALSDDEKPDKSYTLNGVFNFEGVKVGYYKIEEMRFPDGYAKLSSSPTFKVDVNDNNELEITLINNPDNLMKIDGGLIILVGNTPGAALPNTGGPGTRLFSILGSILILGAGVLLWRRLEIGAR